MTFGENGGRLEDLAALILQTVITQVLQRVDTCTATEDILDDLDVDLNDEEFDDLVDLIDTAQLNFNEVSIRWADAGEGA